MNTPNEHFETSESDQYTEPQQSVGINLDDLSWWQKTKDMYRYAKEDFKATDRRGKAILAGLILMGSYEWGPGNETLTPMIAGQSLDIDNGLKGIAITAGITGATVLGQQLTSSFLARKSVQEFPRVSDRAYEYLNYDIDENEGLTYLPFSELSPVKKWVYSFSLGSSFVVAREAAVTGELNDRRLKHVGRIGSLITASSVAIMAATVDTINQEFSDNDPIQMFIDWGIKNPIFWLGVMGVMIANDKRRSSKRAGNKTTD